MGAKPQTDHELLLLISQSINNMKEDINEIKEQMREQENDLFTKCGIIEDRITNLENFRWFTCGGLSVLIILVGWILTIIY